MKVIIEHARACTWLQKRTVKVNKPDFIIKVAHFHVTVLGVTSYLPSYVAVSPDYQSDGSDPFRFSSWFFVRFINKSEISSLVSIPFEMATNRAAMAIPVHTFTLCITPFIFLMEKEHIGMLGNAHVCVCPWKCF
eukprot:scaffold104111_cov65-Attheya_sp.AAC.6